MFHSLKAQKFKVDGKEVQRPAIWSILMRVPLRVIQKSTSAGTTTLRLPCILTEAVFHDWIGSYCPRATKYSDQSPWNHPDRIWRGTNTHPPLLSGIKAILSPELTRRRRQLRARKATQEYRGCLSQRNPAALKASWKKSNDARKARNRSDLDESMQKLATPGNQIRVIKYFEDDHVEFMAHLLKWRGVSIEDQAAIIKADSRPLLEREVAHTMTRKEYRSFHHVIDNRYWNAVRVLERKTKAKSGSASAKTAKANAPMHSKNTDDKPKKAWLVCPVPDCLNSRVYKERLGVIRHVMGTHKMTYMEANNLVPKRPVTEREPGRFKCHFDGCERAKIGFLTGHSLKRHLMGKTGTGHRLSKEKAQEAEEVYFLRKVRKGDKCILKSCPDSKIGFTYLSGLRVHLEKAHRALSAAGVGRLIDKGASAQMQGPTSADHTCQP